VLPADLFGNFLEPANGLPEPSDKDAAAKTAAEPSRPAVEVTDARKAQLCPAGVTGEWAC
jgi:hypothetical protein